MSAAMRFGLFSEVTVPRPWRPTSEYDAYQEAVEQAVLAEALGYDSFWTVEHHFTEEFSHCSAPEVLYAYLAAKTTTLRLGHAVKLLPFPYNHPVRVAEQAAVLDLLSGGRLEFGTGRSATRTEIEGFGIDPHQTRELYDEALQVVVHAWTDDELEWHGKHFDIPRRRVVPKPYQAPHPPVWQATTSTDGHRTVGEHGLGLLSFTVAHSIDSLAERIALYHEGLRSARPVTRAVNDRVAAYTMVYCAESTERAYEEAGDAFLWYVENSFKQFATLASWMEGKEFGTYEHLKTLLDVDFSDLNIEFLVDIGAVVIGDPEQCMKLASGYRDAGCNILLCHVNPKDLPRDRVLESIRLLGEHVLPEFASTPAAGGRT
jgi:alkanesulfonate monooxygenase SsuD/methylene tetrahydromethanopterin reductase-like flavin-dependent oxidoreductase (luciferase family)